MIRFPTKLILAICLLLSPAFAFAQTATVPVSGKADSPSAVEILAHARELYTQEGPKAALPEFEKALALFQKSNDRKNEAITLGWIGNCYKKFGEFPKAEDYLQRALTMKRTIRDRLEEGKTLSHLGLLHWEMADYRLAVEYLDNAIKIGAEVQDRTLEGSARNNLGLVFDEMGQYRKSLEQYEQALKLYQGTNFERGISDTLGNMGGVPLLLGEYAKALGYYQQALEIDERNKLKPGICLDLQDIGLAYTGLGRIPEAIRSFDRSIQIAAEAGLKKEEADSRKGKGSALMQLGRYNDALDQYRRALQAYEQAGMKQELIEGLDDTGNFNLSMGDAASAEKDYRRALDLARAINHPRGVIYSLIALGDIEWRRKRFNEATALYKEALAKAIDANDRAAQASAHLKLALTYRSSKRASDALADANSSLEISRSIGARGAEAEALYVYAELLRDLGKPDEAIKQISAGEQIAAQIANPELIWRLAFVRGQALEAVNRNEEALAAYQSAVKTIEQVRGELREERFRAGYIEDKYQVYVALVQLLLKLGKADEAFLFSERLRARSYLDLITRGQPPVRNDEQRQQETVLRNRIRELQKRLEEEAGKPQPERRGESVDLFSRELANAERDYQSFLDDLLSIDPNYAAARSLKSPSSEEVQRQLPAGTALVEYVLGEQSLDIFVITANEVRATTVPVRAADLQSKVEFLRDLMLRKTTDEWRAPATSLYQTLIAPIETKGWLRGINRLYIVPHAILHYLPFSALAQSVRTASGSDRINNANRINTGDRLLIDDYVIAYLPAAAALVYGSKNNAATNSMLAMAPASTRLRYTQQESQNVSAFFPKRNMLLLGPSATESSFKNVAGQYDVIHLATHGYFNKLNPLLSGVTLEADADNDGRLEVHEILGLRLNAKLVTLSACDTALGSGYFEEIPAGDDLVGLTRAFLFAGSPTVMASLWEVNDLSAVRLMHRFYQELAVNDKAGALANAQRNLRRGNGPYRHPYYWSGLVLVGQMK